MQRPFSALFQRNPQQIDDSSAVPVTSAGAQPIDLGRQAGMVRQQIAVCDKM